MHILRCYANLRPSLLGYYSFAWPWQLGFGLRLDRWLWHWCLRRLPVAMVAVRLSPGINSIYSIQHPAQIWGPEARNCIPPTHGREARLARAAAFGAGVVPDPNVMKCSSVCLIVNLIQKRVEKTYSRAVVPLPMGIDQADNAGNHRRGGRGPVLGNRFVLKPDKKIVCQGRDVRVTPSTT